MISSDEFGQSLKGKYSRVFFGNTLFNDRILEEKFSNHLHLKQVHGNKVINAVPGKQMRVADGHHTDKKNLALVIQTADCMPVLFETNNRVFALHIGWKGLQQKILSEAVSSIKSAEVLGKLWVGPHIHQRHFDFGKALSNALLKAHGMAWSRALKDEIAIPSENRMEHFKLDLSAILKRESEKLGFKDVWTSTTSTFGSPILASHRRHPHHKKRNYSLIIRD